METEIIQCSKAKGISNKKTYLQVKQNDHSFMYELLKKGKRTKGRESIFKDCRRIAVCCTSQMPENNC